MFEEANNLILTLHRHVIDFLTLDSDIQIPMIIIVFALKLKLF